MRTARSGYARPSRSRGRRSTCAWEPRPCRRRERPQVRLSRRGFLAGTVFHSDHGGVYTSKAYVKLCKRLKITHSMGANGTSADNSFAESFNAALKRELLEGRAAFPDQTHLPDRVTVGKPLQHPPPIRDREHQSEQLRESPRNRRVRYPRGSGMTEPTPCPRSRVKARQVTGSNATLCGSNSAPIEATYVREVP